MSGFSDRLRKELNVLAPRSCEVTIIEDKHRHLAVWKGINPIQCYLLAKPCMILVSLFGLLITLPECLIHQIT